MYSKTRPKFSQILLSGESELKSKDEVGDVEAALDLTGIPEEVAEYARSRLGETPESRVVLCEELRELVYQRGEVDPLRMDDDYLVKFLRARNFKLEAAYRLLVNYCEFRENNPHYYEDVNPLDLYYIGDADIISVLPYRDQHGRRIIVVKVGKWDPSTTPIDDLFKATIAILEAGILEPRAQILGGVAILDMDGLSMGHAWQVTPTVASKVVQVMVTSMAYKIAAIHIVNESWMFEKIFSIFTPFLSERYSEMVFFHGEDRKSLHEHIQPKYLPQIYGGIRPEYGYADWFRSLTRDERVVKEMRALGYSYRVEDGQAADDTKTTQ